MVVVFISSLDGLEGAIILGNAGNDATKEKPPPLSPRLHLFRPPLLPHHASSVLMGGWADPGGSARVEEPPPVLPRSL